MLTKIHIKNFKRFDDVELELGKNVVFIGPNDSGKTTALQAFALWEIGLHRWNEKRKGKSSEAQQRQGVVINRRDLIPIPIPSANLIWRMLHVRNVQRVKGQTRTQNIRIEIIVSGITNGQSWDCGFEFDYANEESLYCRPLRVDDNEQPSRMPVPELANDTRVAYLPPMSGLSDREFEKRPGEIGVLIGQGQTAQVLRNLCYRVCWPNNPKDDPSEDWMKMTDYIRTYFGIKLLTPEYIAERSEIVMAYEEKGVRMDLSSTGRGAQQTLLLLAHLYANPGSVLLLDEPDAHLEVLRQRQIYKLLLDVADAKDSQVIMASHSEVVLNEAANLGKIIAFVGYPHPMNEGTSQIIKSLTNLGWEQYFQAEQKGWILYVEDSTDLAILQAFAQKLNHLAAKDLEQVFVHYVTTNIPNKAREHFYGLKEGKPDLIGVAIFDRIENSLNQDQPLLETMWRRREIENYFCKKDILLRWAEGEQKYDLFTYQEGPKRRLAMEESINEVTRLLEIDEKDPWSEDVKASDEVLDRIFRLFFKKMKLPITFRKADYHELVNFMKPEEIQKEIVEKLDYIHKIAESAKPRK
jgi:ABC-type multidrug transport system ATPase subunit